MSQHTDPVSCTGHALYDTDGFLWTRHKPPCYARGRRGRVP